MNKDNKIAKSLTSMALFHLTTSISSNKPIMMKIKFSIYSSEGVN